MNENEKKVLSDEELENATGGAVLPLLSRISEQTEYVVGGPVLPLESCGNTHKEYCIENAINSGMKLGLDGIDKLKK